jgi:hypothetical protein
MEFLCLFLLHVWLAPHNNADTAEVVKNKTWQHPPQVHWLLWQVRCHIMLVTVM